MELPVFIERTTNRTSRAFLKNNTIVIRLAKRLTAALEREHIEILVRRINKAHERNATKVTIDPFRTHLNSKESTLHTHAVRVCTGQKITFSIVEGAKTKATRTEDGWFVTRGRNMSDKVFHRFLWKLTSTSIEREIARIVRSVNAATLRVPIQSISLKFMQSRWGSCSHLGNIALSTTLLFTSSEILEYVIIHELAHVVHMNHSRSFWTLVEEHCPEHRKIRKEICEYRLPTI